MARAERQLDETIDGALRALRETREFVDEYERRDVPPVTDAEVNQLASFVTRHAHTLEWDRVRARISEGELTWRDVAENIRADRPDPDIAAAMRSLRSLPSLDFEELVALWQPASQGGVEPPPPEPQPVEVPDDDYYESFSIRVDPRG